MKLMYERHKGRVDCDNASSNRPWIRSNGKGHQAHGRGDAHGAGERGDPQAEGGQGPLPDRPRQRRFMMWLAIRPSLARGSRSARCG